MDKIQSFPPIIDQQARVLILGSMPGEESLRKQQYYGHPRNQFWPIIYGLFNLQVEEDYDQKVKLLKAKGIALWDVIKACYREGSLDSNIKDEEANDFQLLFSTYPQINHVFFNGGKAYDTFKRKVGFSNFPNMEFTKLESTSPANTKAFEAKLAKWLEIKKYLR